MKKVFALVAGVGVLVSGVTPSFGQTIFADDDVFVESDNLTFTNAYDGLVQSPQIVFGLAAANGVATGRRRSFIEFTLGNAPVTSATFMIYNYWGANMGGGGNPAGNGSLRLRATPVGTPLTFTEPVVPLDTAWAIPQDASFTSTITTITVNTVGWQTIDVTSWYNARLGQTTTLLLRGAQTAGFDFPIYEDRENTAFLTGANNTIANAGPRIEIVAVPEPTGLSLLALGGGLLILIRRRR